VPVISSIITSSLKVINLNWLQWCKARLTVGICLNWQGISTSTNVHPREGDNWSKTVPVNRLVASYFLHILPPTVESTKWFLIYIYLLLMWFHNMALATFPLPALLFLLCRVHKQKEMEAGIMVCVCVCVCVRACMRYWFLLPPIVEHFGTVLSHDWTWL
jgi:hypothetical protein